MRENFLVSLSRDLVNTCLKGISSEKLGRRSRKNFKRKRKTKCLPLDANQTESAKYHNIFRKGH